MKKGFTLIELLVVVLIIGILSAIALPQYTKAVEKSRGTQALTLLKALHQAQQAHHLANGTYSDSFSELDVSVPWSGSDSLVQNQDWSVRLYTDANPNVHRIYIQRLRGSYAGCGFAILYDVWKNKIMCYEPTARTTSGDYCQKIFSGTKKDTSDTYYYWELPY